MQVMEAIHWFPDKTRKTAASTNGYKGAHGQILRELSRLVTAAVRESRELINAIKDGSTTPIASCA